MDATSVHPESYPTARRILAAAGVRMDRAGTPLSGVDPAEFVNGGVGLPTVLDIMAELKKPGRDPRPAFETASFSEGIERISDLLPGMILDGVVTNVAAFGAFVDIGVHQDGLVHVSAMSTTFISNPRDVVKSGQVVRVKVLESDPERKRISLSLRLDDDASAPRKPRQTQPQGKPRQAQPRQSPRQQQQRDAGSRGSSAAAVRTKAAEPAVGVDRRRPPEPPGAMAEALRKAGLG